MTIEVKKPELESLIRERLDSGAFHDVDDLLLQALHALPSPSVSQRKKNFAEFLLESPLPGSGLKLERKKDYPLPA